MHFSLNFEHLWYYIHTLILFFKSDSYLLQSWVLLQSSYRSEILPRKSIFYWAWRELHIAITCRERERESRIRGGLFQLGFLWMTRGASLSMWDQTAMNDVHLKKKRCVVDALPTIQQDPCTLANMTKRNSFFSFYLLDCVVECISLRLSISRCCCLFHQGALKTFAF